jgi:hypothetical protein
MKKSDTAGTHFNVRVVECRVAAKVSDQYWLAFSYGKNSFIFGTTRIYSYQFNPVLVNSCTWGNMYVHVSCACLFSEGFSHGSLVLFCFLFVFFFGERLLTYLQQYSIPTSTFFYLLCLVFGQNQGSQVEKHPSLAWSTRQIKCQIGWYVSNRRIQKNDI